MMKHFILAMAMVLALVASPTWAQTETVVIEGALEYWEGDDLLNDVEAISRFRAVITYDSSGMSTAGYSQSEYFEDTFSAVELHFLDSSGAIIPQDFPTLLTTDANGTLNGSWHDFDGPLPAQSGQNQIVLSDIYYETTAQEGFTFFLDLDNGNNLTAAVFEDVNGVLRYVEYLGDGNLRGVFNMYSEMDETGLDVEFNVDTVYYGGDYDGDGIFNLNDTCPFSIMDETVSFDGWLNSGVTNHVDASGCSIMDHYAACEAEEEEQQQPTSPWGWFQPVYSGPSYCETQVAYELQSNGVIDYTEGRMLRRALSLSYQSEGPR